MPKLEICGDTISSEEQKPGELQCTAELRQICPWAQQTQQEQSIPPYHLCTDVGRGGLPSLPLLLGEACMAPGGILRLSMVTLARCTRCSNANLSAPKDVRRDISLWSSGAALGEQLGTQK